MTALRVEALPVPVQTTEREAGLDALKGALTLLVVLHHTALTYGATGAWFYRELRPDGSASSALLSFFAGVNQSFFMGLFFLIAGFFTPAALQRKGGWFFMRDRLLRLGLPLLVFGFVLGPFTWALAQGHTFAGGLDLLMRMWRSGRFIPGQMWFAQALLVFGGAAVLWHALMPIGKRFTGMAAERPAFPTQSSLLVAALACGAVAFGLRLVWPVNVAVWHMLPGYFASYVLLFAVGCIAARKRWLDNIPERSVREWRRVAWCALPALPLVVGLGAVSPIFKGPLIGGWNVPALVYAMWEPLLAWGIILTLLQRFKQRFAQPASPRWQALSRRAYAIYVIHPPVLVGVALAWQSVPWPALVKFALTGAVSCLLCFWIAGGLLRSAWLRRVL